MDYALTPSEVATGCCDFCGQPLPFFPVFASSGYVCRRCYRPLDASPPPDLCVGGET